MEPMISQNPWLEVETIPEPAAKLMLLAEVTDIFDFSIEWHSLPDGDDKQKVLDVIAVA